jgi:hypothetical protein
MTFSVSDAEGDALTIGALSLAADGDIEQTVALPLDATTFPLGVPSFPVGTDGAPIAAGVAWDSRAAAPFDFDGAVLLLSVTDALGAASAPATSGAFRIDNADSAPASTVRPPSARRWPETSPFDVTIADGQETGLATSTAGQDLRARM